MRSATYKDTFDHMMGSGAIDYDWWYRVEYVGYDYRNDTLTTGWTAEITAEHPTEDMPAVVKFKISHDLIMAAAKAIVGLWLDSPEKSRELFLNDGTVRECANLMFMPDCVDFDADLADQLLQFMAYGKVVFG